MSADLIKSIAAEAAQVMGLKREVMPDLDAGLDDGTDPRQEYASLSTQADIAADKKMWKKAADIHQDLASLAGTSKNDNLYSKREVQHLGAVKYYEALASGDTPEEATTARNETMEFYSRQKRAELLDEVEDADIRPTELAVTNLWAVTDEGLQDDNSTE